MTDEEFEALLEECKRSVRQCIRTAEEADKYLIKEIKHRHGKKLKEAQRRLYINRDDFYDGFAEDLITVSAFETDIELAFATDSEMEQMLIDSGIIK